MFRIQLLIKEESPLGCLADCETGVEMIQSFDIGIRQVAGALRIVVCDCNLNQSVLADLDRCAPLEVCLRFQQRSSLIDLLQPIRRDQLIGNRATRKHACV